MAITFKDFGRGSSRKLPFAFALAENNLTRMNAWVDENNIDVISIETLHDIVDGEYREAIRVWYRE